MTAHVALARTEIGAIADEIKMVAALASGAVAILLFAAMLLPIGLTLFAGEWLFGSMGWGVLHGTELSVAVAVLLALAALGVSGRRMTVSFVAALIVGVVVAVVFALHLPNEGWTRLGDSAFASIEAANRPLVAAFVGGAIVVGVIVALSGLRGGGFAGLLGGLVSGAVIGALIGAFTAITFTPEVAAAVGIALGLAIWPALSALALRGYNWDRLKARFYPSTTIDTVQETVEWLKQIRPRTPPANRS